jgi:hypothetical protein
MQLVMFFFEEVATSIVQDVNHGGIFFGKQPGHVLLCCSANGKRLLHV